MVILSIHKQQKTEEHKVIVFLKTSDINVMRNKNKGVIVVVVMWFSMQKY